ncbi:unnamed protein product, partial [Phaeothamnion confervicola]
LAQPEKLVLFDASKRESHHPGTGFKKLARRLKSSYRVGVNKDDLSLERLQEASLVVFGSPRQKFSQEEFEAIKAYLRGGGSVAVLLAEGGETALGTNVNYLLEEFGMAVHADAVVRTTYYKYPHPKEALISHGLLNPELARQKISASLKAPRSAKARSEVPGPSSTVAAIGDAAANGGAIGAANGGVSNDSAGGSSGGGLSFVYPYGSSMTVQAPAHPVLSTGPICYPLNRPVAAVWEAPVPAPGGGRSKGSGNGALEPQDDDVGRPSFSSPSSNAVTGGRNGQGGNVGGKGGSGNGGGGRLLVVGSTEMFGDEWLEKEENSRLGDVLVRWLLGDGGVRLERQREYDVAEPARAPSVEALADRLRSCLQDTEELPRNFTKLFDASLFSFGTRRVPEAAALYSQLGVKHEPLTLIPPTFECPLPQLTPAVFPPALREAPPPALDQYDLDEHFASDRARLAQLANKCGGGGGGGTGGNGGAVVGEDDLEYFVCEAGEVVGAQGEMDAAAAAAGGGGGGGGAGSSGGNSAKAVLHHIVLQLMRFKMLNQDGGMGGGGNGGMGGGDEGYGGLGGSGSFVNHGGAAGSPAGGVAPGSTGNDGSGGVGGGGGGGGAGGVGGPQGW